ncbi:MAG: SDR family NAD(P)-dependent oxidoreductase [Rhodospirillales bacterium]|nr:SDR family NAD(P)-dependent oxidoreductase [Rhodospirillales bacterium]
MRLLNKTGIITGPAKGMGQAISETLAREGADLVLAGRDVAAIEPVAANIRAMGRRVEIVRADVTNAKDVEAMVTRAASFFDGRIDILVNVAGMTGPIETPVWEIEPEDFELMLRTNVIGTFLPIKYTVPHMIKRKSGKIVNIGGTSGLRGYRYRTAYSASKWAVRGVTRTVALDVGEYNINVNVVCPGIVKGPRMDKLCEGKAKRRGWTTEQVYQEYIDDMALQRVTESEDVANAVLFLVSEESRQMTGHEVAVDGGWDV